MKLEDITPAHCFARATRLLGEATLIREELGRSEDSRMAPEITGAKPRECFFEAIAAFRKAQRLANEVGAQAPQAVPTPPSLREIRPGHVAQILDAVGATLSAIKTMLGVAETISEAAIESSHQPSDVLKSIIHLNRELSRCLERPFAPSDCYDIVAQASAYAERLGAAPQPAAFERRRKPKNCYEVLEACLASAATHIAKRGESALTTRGTPENVLPGDVYDLAHLVLCELAFLHSLSTATLPVHAFTAVSSTHRLPSHVHQLARTLENQLAALK